MGVLMGVFEQAPGSVTGGTVRKTMSWIGGRGFVDPVPGADEMRSALKKTPSSISTATDLSSSDESIDPGSVLLGSTGSAGEAERVLDEDLVKSPTAM